MNIWSILISYSGFVFVLIHCTPFVFPLIFGNVHPPTHILLSSWMFPHIDLKDQACCNNVFSDILSLVYLGIYHFMFLTECFPKVGTFMRIIWYYVTIRSGQSGLESGALVDGYVYQNKDKNITIMKNKSVIFSVQCIIAKTMWFPTLLLLPSWTSSWIFSSAEKQQNASQILQIQRLLKTIRK